MQTQIESELINVYDKIATHFDKTRVSHWKKVKEFVNSLPEDTLLGDIGCGNGKNMKIRKDLKYIGVDASQEFYKLVINNGYECIQGNILNIPLGNNTVDNTLCVAVIHHLSTKENRKRAINELIRITKPGGKIFIQVWANMDGKECDKLVKWTHNKKYGSDGVYNRYYHFFGKYELENLISGDVNIQESFLDHDNYGIILEKI